jgi:hypothetical protein
MCQPDPRIDRRIRNGIGGGMANSSSLLELFQILEKELNLRLKYTQLPLAPQRSEILRGGQFESGIDAGLETADNQARRNFENNCLGPRGYVTRTDSTKDRQIEFVIAFWKPTEK